MQRKVLVTGGAGFIGSASCRRLVGDGASALIYALTYAGNLQSLVVIGNVLNYRFAKIDICDRRAAHRGLRDLRSRPVMHLAAESHVDRSIDGLRRFIETNVVGTFSPAAKRAAYWRALPEPRREGFRFLHISTDEVLRLARRGRRIRAKTTPYRPEFPLFGHEGRRRSSGARLARVPTASRR